MALFRYTALKSSGKVVKGVVDADTLEAAKEKLRKQELMVRTIVLREKNKNELFLDPDLLLAFTRELAQLLRAGLPLYESLLTIEEKYRLHKAHPLFLGLCDHLKTGSSLSSALRRYPKSFDGIYLSMILAGEQSGSLAYVLDQLSQLISRQHKLKKQLSSALIYPAFLGVFCLLVISSLLFFVIPSMQELFEGRALHPLTQMVLSISVFANENILSILSVIATSVVATFLFLRSKRGKVAIQKTLIKLPFFKTVIIQGALTRFCRSSSILLLGGVPLIETLSLSRSVMKNPLLEQLIANAEKRIVEGSPLSEQFKQASFIPPLVPRMLAIAEETGRMAPMMQNIAEIYDEELERSLHQLTTLLQPILLLILGGIVGVVLLSVLLPLTDVSSFLQ
jgi:general secretion pathway protein F/type IV pilus assembly protein PilC